MEESARRFVRRVLLIHLLLLALVVTFLISASHEVYQRTRQHILKQASSRQHLLASQTAQGIESYYSSILADLQFFRRTEEIDLPNVQQSISAIPSLRFSQALWSQLQDRVSMLFLINRSTLVIPHVFPNEKLSAAKEIASLSGPWIHAVDSPSLSRYIKLPAGGGNLVAVPLMSDWLLIAVVPIRNIEIRFLDKVNQQGSMSATLVDEAGNVMATSDPQMVGLSLVNDVNDPSVRAMIRDYLMSRRGDTKVITQSVEIGGSKLSPRMITVEPIPFHGGKTWSVFIASELSTIETIVNSLFDRALWWAVFAAISMTAILASTAFQLIRGQMRMERFRHELLSHEISHAREIQLAWLPRPLDRALPLQVAAVNHPANHISGDFYDWFQLPDQRWVVTIGDVTGHGMGAAFLMSTTQLLVRSTMMQLGEPSLCLKEVNRQLCTQIFHGQFVTMLILVLDLERNALELSAAGHPAPFIGHDGQFVPLDMDSQLVLGIEPNVDYTTQHFPLAPDSSLLLYTDGVSDVQSVNGDRFGTDRIQRSLQLHPNTAQEIIDAVIDAVTNFRTSRSLADDLTLVAIHLQTAPFSENNNAAINKTSQHA